MWNRLLILMAVAAVTLTARAGARAAGAAEDPDLSSPEQALRSAWRAAVGGDEAALRAIYVPGEASDRAAAAWAAYMKAGRALNAAADERFGRGDDIFPQANPDLAPLMQVPPDGVKIDGDQATIILGGRKGEGGVVAARFRRIDGRWRVEPLGDESVKGMETLAKAVPEMTKEIREGKYADRAAVASAWREKQQKAVPPPATRPSPKAPVEKKG